jgi:tetratricopeptide (TPR) repeat protein
VAKELGLEDLRPVVVSDDQRRPLGEVYPERGLMFAYAEGATDSREASVEHVILETITVEPFLLRAQQEPLDHYSQRRADLQIAQQLAPADPVAFGLAARVDIACGKPLTALAAAQKAVELSPQSVEYQITLADARRQLGQSREALEMTRTVLRQSDLSPLDQARARFILGRILATTAPRNYRQAMEETVSAIKVAAAQIDSAEGETRTQIRQVLLDAELSLAEILAYGPWKQKHQVIPQWLVTAEKAANEYIQKDGGPRRVLLNVYSTSLHCLLVLDGQGAPDNIADAAIQLGRDLIAQAEDDDYRAAIEWQLGTGLWYAAQVAQRQGHASAALQYASNADALLVSGGKTRSESPETAHHLAQLHFLTGSIYAIDRKDDATAVRWFDKALPHLRATFPGSLLDERGLIGEQLVSVGISLWETGRRNTAVSVTEEGASLIAQAVEDGAVKKSVLSVPYQNLAEMHRQLGNTDKADRLADKAIEADPEANKAVKRR